MSMFHCNIRSANHNADDLHNYLMSLNHNFDIIGLSETWLSKNNETIPSFDDYNHVMKYREGKIGGRVSLLIRDSITYK